MTETGLNTMMGEAAKSIQESGGKHVGVFEAKIIMAGRVLIVLTLIAVGSLLVYQVHTHPHTHSHARRYTFFLRSRSFFFLRAFRAPRSLTHARLVSSLSLYLCGHTHTQVGFRDVPLAEVLEMSLSLVIASVPIALPMVMKVTLAVGAKEMAKEGGIVTHLTALEEIASMVVLCSDKTGAQPPPPSQRHTASKQANVTLTHPPPSSLSCAHRYSHDRPDDCLPRDRRVLLGPQR